MTGANAKIKRIYVGDTQCRPIRGLPSAYQAVEYIGRNGNNYIDSGWIPKITTNFEVQMGIRPPTSGVRYGLLSNRGDSSLGNAKGSISLEINSSNKMRFYSSIDLQPGQSGTEEFLSSNLVTINQFNDVIFKCNGSNTGLSINLNGTTTTGSLGNTTYRNVSAFIFVDREKRFSTLYSFDLSYCKIYENGTLVRDFVPCYRKSDNVIGLYDLVNNQFYTNSGTGTFTKGPDVN